MSWRPQRRDFRRRCFTYLVCSPRLLEVGRRKHHQHRGLTEVVLQETGPPIVRSIRRDDRDRGRGAADVPRPLPDAGEVAQLLGGR